MRYIIVENETMMESPSWMYNDFVCEYLIIDTVEQQIIQRELDYDRAYAQIKILNGTEEQ